MFGFGFALAPLYDMFCQSFGINGKTGITSEAVAREVDDTRWVTVVFTGGTTTGLPWEFRPKVSEMKVHPGAIAETSYYARNTSSYDMIGRAIPSVDPGEAAPHFKKTECFCFTEQKLKAGEARWMPVRFVVDRDLPRDVQTITLSYSFFNAEKYAKGKDGRS